MSPPSVDLQAIPGPIILAGDEHTAYRDPLLHYHEGIFRLFCSVVLTRTDGNDRFHVAVTESRDLSSWGPLRPVTVPNDPRSFCGPGGIVRHDGRWVLCLSSYPRPNIHDARCWTTASDDLQSWQEPRTLQLKGPAVPVRDTGRALDPYIFRDKDDPERWWCCYKHGGVLLGRAHGLGFGGTPIPPDSLLLQSMQLSFSHDLERWTPYAQTDGEENYCMLVDEAEDEYLLVHSPANGIGIKRSTDLVNWYDDCLYTLGQRQWRWAQGRITAGHLLDLRSHPAVGKYLLTFHGATRHGRRERAHHGEASTAITWSDDLLRWFWPGGPEQGDADAAAAPCA